MLFETGGTSVVLADTVRCFTGRDEPQKEACGCEIMKTQDNVAKSWHYVPSSSVRRVSTLQNGRKKKQNKRLYTTVLRILWLFAGVFWQSCNQSTRFIKLASLSTKFHALRRSRMDNVRPWMLECFSTPSHSPPLPTCNQQTVTRARTK